MKPRKEPALTGNDNAPDKAAETTTDTRTARIRITKTGARARNFTFAKGAVVEAVPIAHAEYLESKGEAAILEVQ